MANSILYTLPVVGQTADPTWEVQLLAALNAIATHTHDGANAGALLSPAALNFSLGNLNLASTPILGGTFFETVNQALPAQTSGKGRLATDASGNLYYVSQTANVLLASPTAISAGATSSNGFFGDYRSASGASTAAGGTSLFNTSSGSWPQTSTFYFYSSAVTPSDDTGTRAGLAGAFLDLLSGGVAPSVRVGYRNGINTKETGALGLTNFSAGFGSFGLQVKTLNSDGLTLSANTTSAFTCFQTTASQTLTESSAGSQKTLGMHINGDPIAATASAAFAHSVRNVTVGSSAPIDCSYWCAQTAVVSGAPSDGYGHRHTWKLGVGVANGSLLADTSVAAGMTAAWASVGNKRGAWTLQVTDGGTFFATPGFDTRIIAGRQCIGLGILGADTGASNIALGYNTAVTGTLNVSGATILSSTLATTGAATFSSSLSANSLIVTGGASTLLAITGTTLNLSGNAVIGGTTLFTGTVSGFTATSAMAGTTLALSGALTAGPITGTTGTFSSHVAVGDVALSGIQSAPTAGVGGLWKNTQVVAWGSITNVGVVTGGYNVASAVWNPGAAGVNVCDVTLSVGVTGGVVVSSVNTIDANNPGYSQCSQTNSTTVRVITVKAPPAAANANQAYAFNFIVLGSP